MATLSLRKLQKSYPGGAPILHGVDLDLEDGEFIVIVGPSGCGKSTLLRLVAGLEQPSGGEILIDGQSVNLREPAERDIAMVFQNYALYPHMSVYDNMAYGLRIRGLTRAEIAQRVKEAAAILGLEALLERRPRQLSGGQRQRVAMGRAIVREPKVFLFDEPLSNLDAKLRVTMRLEILKLQRRLNTTSLYVTHDQVEAMTLAHRMVVMNQGHAEQIGTPAEVFERPASTFVAAFIGSPPMNLIPVDIAADGTVRHAEGTRLGLSSQAVPAALRARRLILGMRPEHMVLDAPGIEGEIEMVETLGSEQLLHLRHGATRLVLRCATRDTGQSGMQVGQRVEIGPDTRHSLHWFDADTGRRVPGL
ncbi:sn-glycerol-3-phosphate import ATP-binding protein UgpC [Bordetella trematum]|uniref:sn-glycerol-3-phosphate import ATP-binding protein UgpC n=1 Tax=Bordetella trematum TaxID=123899 RepID=UPI0039898C24